MRLAGNWFPLSSNRFLRQSIAFGLLVATLLFPVMLLLAAPPRLSAAAATITIDTPLPPPYWALLERQLLRANADAVAAWAERYIDQRGYLRVTPRWGGLDGPDDATENFYNWPLLRAYRERIRLAVLPFPSVSRIPLQTTEIYLNLSPEHVVEEFQQKW